MPFLGPNMSNTVKGLMLSGGMAGSDVSKIANAISNGSQMAVVGKTFSTADTGLVVGAGPAVGVGVGVTIDDGIIKAAILAKGIATGLVGADFEKVAGAMAKAFSNEMKLVSLNSTHAPVYSGSGQIIQGSIAVQGKEIGDNSFKLGSGFGLIGSDFKKVADAIGFGFGEGVKIGIGKVNITGSPVPPPPPPAPGTGSSISGVLS